MFWNTCINQSILELLQPIRNTLQLIILQFLVIVWEVSISVGSCHKFPRADVSSLALSLLLVAGISMSFTVSCDEDEGVDEEEELMDKPSTTNGT